MKKSLKFVALLMILTMLSASINVFAAVSEVVPGQTILSQNFSGLSVLPDSWSIKKQGVSESQSITPEFNDKGMSTNLKGNLWIGCNSAFNAQSNEYTANFSFSKMNSGSMVMVVGGNDTWYETMTNYNTPSSSSPLIASPVGYTIQLCHSSLTDSIALYKNGNVLTTGNIKALGTGVSSVGSFATYNVDLKVTSSQVILTVTGFTSLGAEYKGSFEADDSSPIYSGYTGVYFASTTNSTDGSTGTLFDMSVKTEASSVSCDKYFMNESFNSASDSVEELGFKSIESYTPAATANGIQLCEIGSSGSTLILDDYKFDGTYNIETSVYFTTNSMSIYLNYQDSSNYYRLDYGKCTKADGTSVWGYVLKKCTDGTLIDVASSDDLVTYAFQKVTTPAEITVKNEADKVTFNVTAYKDGNSYEWSCTDSSNPFISGKVGMKASYVGETYLKSFKIYSSEPEYTSGSTVGEDVILSIPYMPWTPENSKVITAVYKNAVTKDFITAGIKNLSDFNISGNALTVLPADENRSEIVIRTYIWDNLSTIEPIISPVVITPEATE